MADPALIRKRLRSEIDAAKRIAAERRARASGAAREYDEFLSVVAIPAFRTLANVLRAENILFEVQTPSGGVRLVADRNRDDAIALELDTSQDPPAPLLIATRTRGQRMLRTERPLQEGAAIAAITEDTVIERLIEELRPFLA